MALYKRLLTCSVLLFCTILAQAQNSSVSTYIATIKEQLAEGLITPDQADEQIMAVQRKSQQRKAPPMHRFVVTTADTNLEDLLRRWGADHGWRVINKAEIRRESFFDAADFTITQARTMGRPIKALAYPNQVLVLFEDK
jgi:hypothetical protein